MISFASETEARRASRALAGGHISAPVVRLPRSATQMGCGYGVEPPPEVLQEALRILRGQFGRGRTLRVYLSRDGEHYLPANGGTGL